MSDEAKYLLDIRSEDEFLEGHMPGARNCQLQELSYVLDDAEPDDLILLVCRTGHRAGQVKALLEEEGYTNVEVYKGGMAAYKGKKVQGE